MAITVKHSKVSTIPDGDDSSLIRPSDWNQDHTLVGVGTAASLDAGVANGVATLDSSGKVPVSQIPALGDLNYQGTWNATTNTPTLTSSVGTKGYYYVVSVAGTTNLNGVTDWQIGDWSVYNGTAWQKIDNTDAVTSVNGQTGTVVLTYSNVGAFPATATTGSGSVVLQTSPTINTPTLSGATVDGSAPYMNYTPTTAPTYLEGRVFYDSTAHTLNYYNDNNQMSVNIGQEQIIRVRNQTGTSIANGAVVYVNGATGNTPTVALALATTFSTADIIGMATTDIANNGFGYVTINGLVNGLDTSAFADGNTIFLSATTPGAYTATEPVAPNYSVQVGVILRANPSTGTILIAPQQISVEVSHIIGTITVSQGGTGQTSYTNGQLLIGNTTGNTLTKSTLTAGTGVSVTNGAGSITLANTGVTSAVAGTGISVSGSTGAVTVTNTAPDQTVALANGTGISVTGTYPSFTITNTAPSSGGTVTSVSGTAPVVSSGGNTPAISMAKATTSVDGYLSSTDWNTFNGKQPAGTYVNSVSGTATRITSTGGVTPVIDLASGVATPGTTGSSTLIPVVTIDTYGRVTGITTASNPQGTVTSVTGTAPVVSSGGATPAISMAAANTTTNGYLTSADWNTFNNKGSGTVTSVTATSPIASSGGTTPNLTLGNVPVANLNSGTGATSSTFWRGDGTWATPNAGTATYGRTSFTATAGQTTFSVTYTPGYLQVYQNGAMLNGTDYTATNGTSVVLGIGASTGDIIETFAYATTTALTPAGSTTQVQYNNAGVLAGSSSFTFDGTILTAPKHLGTASVTASGNQGAFAYGTLSYSDTDVIASLQSSTNSYNQLILQNTNAGASASTNLIVSNDNGTATTNYGEIGINSSGFTGTGSFNTPGSVYVTSSSTDLAIGTVGANAVHFVTNGRATDSGSISSAGRWAINNATTNTTATALLHLGAGTATASTAPLKLTSGTNLTVAEAGSVEYDGNNFYMTVDTSQGRNVNLTVQQFYLSAAGSALTGATQNFFGANSAASLAAGSTYDIECYCYFLKTTAGTIQWIPTFSSAITVGHSYLEYTPVTGFTTTVITGAMVLAEATQQTTTVLTHAATASLTTAVYHIAKLRIRVTTNLACNFRLNNTIGTGTITPQAGSYYTVRKVVTNAGNFVA